MAFEIDTRIPWTEHFVRHGFAVLRNQVSKAFTDRAMERIRAGLTEPARSLPCESWTVANATWAEKPGPGDPVLDGIYDEPNIRRIIDTLYGTSAVGSPTGWSGEKSYQVFLTAFSPEQPQPKAYEGGHIDFGGHLIPKFGNAFVMQVCLRDTEPFGGNITVMAGSHQHVQKRVLADPYTQYPADFDWNDMPSTELFEFVAKAGDVLLMQHLSFHSGNACTATGRRPRVALHMQVPRSTFLTKVDPADATNPPWVRSFALNGPHEDPEDQTRYMGFGEAKKRLWGEWTSDDGQAWFKVFTWADGALRSRLRLGALPDQISRGARFDGRRLQFGCDAVVSGAGGPKATPVPCRVVLEVDSNDGDRMHGTIAPESNPAGARAIALRKTAIISTRLTGYDV
ncbi:MAG: hypothetical protein NTW19_04090 [Planctomycetota bacterium]|nr:hypothetical protein [Planctomycetota bacterium]